MTSRRVYGFLQLCLLMSFGTFLWGQETQSIVGTITDPTSSVIANVKVTLTNTATGQTQSVQTNGSGNYTISNVQIGTYNLSAEEQGFTKYQRTGIVVTLNQTVRVDATLQIGDVNQSVTVAADAVQVQSDSSEVSNMISGSQVTQLAINGRNPVQLATLMPGVSSNLPDFNAPNALSSNTSISFNGQRSDHNVWMIDGGEDYDRGSGGGFSVIPSPDAVAEFRVLTSNYSPEFGGGSGGVVTLALKSGTQQFHGGLWEFNRNDAFDANDFFANRAGAKKPELRFNTYGFNIGGPVYIPKVYNKSKQKTFFFYNMEWRKLVQGTVITHVTFPEAFYTGDLSSVNKALHLPTTTNPKALAAFAAAGLSSGAPLPGNKIPASLIDPNAALLLKQGVFPFPNTTGNQWSGSLGVPTNVREEIIRIDHHFSDTVSLMGHYIQENANQQTATAAWDNQTFPTLGTQQISPSYSAVVRLSWSISPTLLNETSYNYNGNRLIFSPVGIYKKPAGWTVPELFASNADNRLPSVNIAGAYSTNYDPGSWPWYNAADSNEVRDDLSWTVGNHNMKMGANFLRYRKNQDIFGNTQGSFNYNGSFTGDAFADFLTGYANSYSELDIEDRGHWRDTMAGVYFVDNWRASRKLTLNLGLRWEALPATYDVQNRMSNFVPSSYNRALAPQFNADGSMNPNGPGFATVTGIPLSNVPFYLNGIGLAGQNGFPRGTTTSYWNNFGPRIGFAYDPTGNGKTVIRGGFGMFYEKIQGNALYNAASDPPFSFNPNLNNVLFSSPTTSALTGLQAAQPTFPAGLTTLAYQDYKNPTSLQWSLQIQQQLAANTVLSVGYVGDGNYHQPDYREVNPVPLNDPNRQAIASNAYNANLDRLYPGFGNIKMMENATGSNYQALQVGLRVENKHGLTLQGAYTWSRELDYTSGDNNGALSNPFNRSFDYGPGSLNRTHIAIFSYIYELPFFKNSQHAFARYTVGGWQVSGVTTFETGPPLTPTIGNDILGLGGNATARPNVSGSVTMPKTVNAWFSPSSFTLPAFGSFGNLGRGAIVGPGRGNWDISLFKEFAFAKKEGARLQFRAETFNTFNHTQFNPNNIDLNFNDANFGAVQAAYDPRIIQLGLKFLF